MNKGLYFWKSKRVPSKMIGVVLIVLFLLIVGLGAGWYYFLYLPQKKMEAEIKAKNAAIERQIKEVNDFYLDKLKGGSVSEFTDLLTEIYKSRIMLRLTGYQENSFTCSPESCTFGYTLKPSVVFNVQKKMFWSNFFSGSFSDTEITYSDIPSKLSGNKIFSSYMAKENVAVPDCGEVLNYIYSYNSTHPSAGEYTVTDPPSSSVSDVEDKVRSRKKYYGLMFGSWTLKTKNDLTKIMSQFDRQAYRDSLIVKSIELSSGDINISGVFVCKSTS